MFNTIMHTGQHVLGTVKNHLAPAAAELKARQQFAFSILHPQVEIVKRSPTTQLTVGTAISGLVLSGNLGTAASLAGAWLCSKPLTYAVAGGVGAMGMADAKLLAAIQQLQTPPVEVATTRA